MLTQQTAILMTNPSTLMAQSSSDDAQYLERITSRFGTVVVDRRAAIQFPRGLLGMPEFTHYALTAFPSERMQQFHILQSLESPELSFIVLPIDIDNPIISRLDIINVSQEMDIALESLACLLVVSVQRMPTQVRITVNARAPLFIDSERRFGMQYVFPHDRYSLQHVVSEK